MKILLVVLLVAVTAVWSYNVGTWTPSAQERRLSGMVETKCDDINYNPKTKQKLVCEVFMQAEDDNIIIYKEMPHGS